MILRNKMLWKREWFKYLLSSSTLHIRNCSILFKPGILMLTVNYSLAATPGSRKAAQLIKELATKPDDMSLISRTHVVEGEKQLS